MRGSAHRGDPQWRVVWMAVGLIVATALLALIVTAIFPSAARASATKASRTVAGEGVPSVACRVDDRGAIWPKTLRTGVRTMLVPQGATFLTVCAYNGMNATAATPQFGLTGNGAVSDTATLTKITSELDALKPATGSYNCPFADDSQDVATFTYQSGPSVVVTLDTKGCNEITNDHVNRLGLDAAPLVSQIEAIAKPATGIKWATVTGRVRECGGPAPGRCRAERGMVNRVVAANSSGTVMAFAYVHGARFRFRIATAGRYTLKAMGVGKQLNTSIAKTTATVNVGQLTNVLLTVPIP